MSGWTQPAGTALAVIGALFALWGLTGSRPRGRRRCPRCWYDLTEITAAQPLPITCSECGFTARKPRQLRRRRRRRVVACLGFVLLIGGYALRVESGVRSRDWAAALPMTLLVAIAPTEKSDSAVDHSLDGELLHRLTNTIPYAWQLRWLRSKLDERERWPRVRVCSRWPREESLMVVIARPAALTPWVWRRVVAVGTFAVHDGEWDTSMIRAASSSTSSRAWQTSGFDLLLLPWPHGKGAGLEFSAVRVDDARLTSTPSREIDRLAVRLPVEFTDGSAVTTESAAVAEALLGHLDLLVARERFTIRDQAGLAARLGDVRAGFDAELLRDGIVVAKSQGFVRADDIFDTFAWQWVDPEAVAAGGTPRIGLQATHEWIDAVSGEIKVSELLGDWSIRLVGSVGLGLRADVPLSDAPTTPGSAYWIGTVTMKLFSDDICTPLQPLGRPSRKLGGLSGYQGCTGLLSRTASPQD